MKPAAPQPLPDALEARLTALLLGELPEAEAAALRAEIAADPALAKLLRRLSLALDLTRETARSIPSGELTQPEPLQLSPERQSALFARFRAGPAKVVPLPRPETGPRFDRRELWSVAAMLVAVLGAGSLLLPSLAKAKSRGSRATAAKEFLELAANAPVAATRGVAPASATEDGDSFAKIESPQAFIARGQVLAKSIIETKPKSPHPAASFGLVPQGLEALADKPSVVAGGKSPPPLEDELMSRPLARNVSDSSGRPLRAEPLSNDYVAANRDSNSQRADDHGGAGLSVPNQIVLPPAEPQVSQAAPGAADRPPQNFFFEQTASPRSPAIGGLAGAARGIHLLPSSPLEGGRVGSGLAADGVIRFDDSSNLAAAAGGAGFGRGNQLGFGGVQPALPSSAPAPTAGAFEALDHKFVELPTGTVSAREVRSLADSETRTVNGPQTASAPREMALYSRSLSPSTDALERRRFGDPGVSQSQVQTASLSGFFDHLEVPRESVLKLGELKASKAALSVPVVADIDRLSTADFTLDSGAAQFVNTKAISTTTNRMAVEKRADLYMVEAMTGVGAGKPVASLGYGAEVAPEATRPALGEVSLSESLATGVSGEAGTLTLARRYREPLKPLSQPIPAPAVAAGIDAASAKKSEATVLDLATAAPDKQISLFARLRQGLGGEATRTAHVRSNPEAPDLQLLGRSVEAPAFDPHFLLSESEVIRSHKILDQVAQRLNLSPAAGAGFRQLEAKVSVNQDQNSGIAAIQVKDSDPAKAALIANTVAEVYAEYRNQLSNGVEARGLRVLQPTFTELEKLSADNSAKIAQSAGNIAPPEPDTPLPKLAPGAPEPQAEVVTADNAFSTFSLNVSDVSFKLAAASLGQGQMPAPGTVRTEEFINAFDYRDPEPNGLAPLAFAWERARYPFAHDRDLVRFSVKTAASGRPPGRPLNLVLLLDNSGSMERADRVRIRQECLRVLAGQLQPQDQVSVVAFARTARLWVDGLPGTQAAELPGRVGELTPDGGTNLEEALRLAYQTAARHYAANGVNRVVLLTDGAANLGDVQPAALQRQVETNRRQGIALDCFGIGWEGFNDELLEVLSRHGDGRYGFVNSPEAATGEFAGQLAGALQVAASDVKVQVEWNPRRVTAYRQLGYAKHQLTKEQFRDNTVDAAEIGAAEAGNALYTVQVNPAGEGPLGTVRVRFRVPGTTDYREHEWPLNYDGKVPALEQAGPALRLAGSASAFSEWLVSSPFAADVSPDRLLGLLTGVAETYAADPRPKQLEQMVRQAKSVSGK